jgi:hypothetical protein
LARAKSPDHLGTPTWRKLKETKDLRDASTRDALRAGESGLAGEGAGPKLAIPVGGEQKRVA